MGESKRLIREGILSIYENRVGIFSIQDIYFKSGETFSSFTFGEFKLAKKT